MLRPKIRLGKSKRRQLKKTKIIKKRLDKKPGLWDSSQINSGQEVKNN